MNFFGFTDIKKRLCRYVLQLYIGPFLQEKLEIDQLSIDLYSGAGHVHNVNLDVEAINKSIQQFNAPVELLKGSVESIYVTIPWTSIFSESCEIQVKGIRLVLQPKYMQDTDLAHMTDSLYNSLKNMTTSMQLAEECLNNTEKEPEGLRFKGLEAFAKEIDNIIRRIKVKFGDITICFEHAASSASFGVGIELNLKHFEYYDEDVDIENKNASKSQSKNVPFVENVAFSCKQFRVSGVSISMYQFPRAKIAVSSVDPPTITYSNESIMQDSVTVVKLFGEQQVKIRFKQNDQLSGPKIDSEFYLCDCAIFLTPKQISLLLDFLEGFLSPSSNDSNYTVDSFPSSMSPIVTHDLHIYNENRNDDNNQFNSLELTPPNTTTVKPKVVKFTQSLVKDDLIVSDTFKSTVEHFHHCNLNDPIKTAHQQMKSLKDNGDSSFSEMFHCQVKVVSLTLAILHTDPSACNSHNSSNIASNPLMTGTCVDQDSHSYLLKLVSKYFSEIESLYMKSSLIDLFQNQSLLTDAAYGHDHLHLLIAPIHFECDRNLADGKSFLSRTVAYASVGNAEFLECLYNKENSVASKSSDSIKLLSFPKLLLKSPKTIHSSGFVGQAIKVSLNILDKTEITHTSVKVELADCTSEVDISITDRLVDLISSFSVEPYKASTNSTNMHPSSYSDDAMFRKALADGSEAKLKKIELTFSSSFLHFDFRFPIPDLQPEMSRRPWFKRMLRDEVLQIDAKDFVSNIEICCSDEVDQYSDQHKSVKCKFREMSAYYSEKPELNQQLFLQTRQCDDQAGNDFDWPFLEIIFQDLKESTHLGTSVDDRANSNSEDYFFPFGSWDMNSKESAPLFNSHYEPSVPRRPSPFSQRKIVHNNEEMVLPGDEEEISKFVEHASSTSKFNVTVNLPNITVSVPSKSFVESLYNRFNNDLLLWTPVAPQPSLPLKGETNIIPARLDFESQFFSAKDSFDEVDCSPNDKFRDSFMTDDENCLSCISQNTKPMQKSTENLQKQSLLSLSLNINQGKISLCSDITTKRGTKTGQVFIELKNGMLFVVSQYLGNSNLDFVCVQVDTCNFYHKIGLFPVPVISDAINTSQLDSLIYPVHDGVVGAFDSRGMSGSSQSQKMATLVFKLELEEKQTHNGIQGLKRCLAAVLLRNVAYRHQFLPLGQSFFDQITDIFDINDIEISGYQPPTFLTEMHFHLSDCAVDYKPQCLNSRVVATISSFDLSSNVVANSPLSILQIMMDNVNLYLSNDCTSNIIDLRQNFVNVLYIALLELCLKLSNETESNKSKLEFPNFELIISNSHVQLKTCADSCALLATLIRYVAQDGDLTESEIEDSMKDTLSCSEEIRIETDNESSIRTVVPVPRKEEERLKASYEQHLEGIIADATVELKHEVAYSDTNSDKLFANQSSISRGKSKFSDEFVDCDDDFCIIDDFDTENEGNNEPKIEYLLEDKDSKVIVYDNYFASVNRRADYLKAPDHFPVPIMRYTIREFSFAWFIYGGNDFYDIDGIGKNPKERKIGTKLTADKNQGGVNRDHNLLMEIYLTKARFQHEKYGSKEQFESRTVFTVSNFEIHDRCKVSRANKFLSHFHNAASPKQSNANMLQIKVLLVRSEEHKDSECRLKISLQPLQLVIDQDALVFLTEFFTNLSEFLSENSDNAHFDDGSTYGTAVSTFAEPQLNIKDYCAKTEVDANQSNVLRPLFINEFIFSPAVPIRLDYEGKRIDIEQGKVTGLIMGLGQLRCSQLTLQKIVHRHGLLGIDKLINFALNTWATDIRNNQLPSILGGVGPMHSFVQIFQGLRDLVWLPVEQYKRDGRIVRGLQRGTASFGTSTSMALLELTNRLVGFVQSTAETACDIVSPADLHKNRERYLNTWRGLEKQARRKRQPNDLREGFNNAVSLVHHGVTDTAYSIARVAQKEHERKGLTGAVGGVIRHIPLTLVRPVIIASEATSNVLSGMRNQILPDAKREDEDKWRISHNEP